MPGLLDKDALLIGVETRTSSPVRVPRDPVTFQSINTRGLYPIGEGAGYAGGIRFTVFISALPAYSALPSEGIMTSAVDGVAAVDALIRTASAVNLC